MDSTNWQPARLIPTGGISGPDEQETRATSSLLAVLTAVREFGSALVKSVGGPGGTIETFIEVPFKLADGRAVRPDGVIRSSRGTRAWTCLVEVKTGNSSLVKDQIEAYLDLAKECKFDAVLTISNELTPAAGVHPVDVDKRKIRTVGLHHRSWTELLSAATIQRVHAGVSDPDQAWILGELIRYLEHPKSGAFDFQDMGPDWVAVREAIAAGTLRPSDKGISSVVSRWDQLLRFAALRLERELGSGVQPMMSRKEAADPSVRLQSHRDTLLSRGTLEGTIRIPSTVGDLNIEADLRTSRVTISVEIAAPGDGRALTRINWLLRQLQSAPDSARVDAFSHMSRTSMSELLKVIRLDPALLMADAKADIRKFKIAAPAPLGIKRGIGRGSFIDTVLAAIDGFYGSVLQGIRPWVAKPPQLPKAGTAVEAAGVDIRVSAEDIAELRASGEVIETSLDSKDSVAVGVMAPPSVGGRVDLEVPLISWDEQLDDLQEERMIEQTR